jgi:hypothetical protein
VRLTIHPLQDDHVAAGALGRASCNMIVHSTAIARSTSDHVAADALGRPSCNMIYPLNNDRPLPQMIMLPQMRWDAPRAT